MVRHVLACLGSSMVIGMGRNQRELLYIIIPSDSTFSIPPGSEYVFK